MSQNIQSVLKSRTSHERVLGLDKLHSKFIELSMPTRSRALLAIMIKNNNGFIEMLDNLELYVKCLFEHLPNSGNSKKNQRILNSYIHHLQIVKSEIKRTIDLGKNVISRQVLGMLQSNYSSIKIMSSQFVTADKCEIAFNGLCLNAIIVWELN